MLANNNNPYDLAKLLADSGRTPEIYVVPDNQMQQQPMPRSQVRYGEEVPRQSWQQATASLVDAISSYQKANPTKVPLPAGTKTLAGKQFEEEKRRFDAEWPYKEQSYQYELNKPYYKPDDSGSSGSGGDNLTKNEALNSLTQKIHDLKNEGYERKDVEDAIYSDASNLGSSVNTQDVKKILDQIYGDSGGGDDVLGAIGDQIGGGGSGDGENMSPDEAMRQALKERPWWQKAIDILPGKQYR